MKEVKEVIEIVDKVTSKFVEYIRYIIVSGLALIYLKINNVDVYKGVVSQEAYIIVLILFSLGMLLYFINRTLVFPIIERITDRCRKNVFRNYIKKKYPEVKFFQSNDLWIIIQDEGKIGEGLSKYKIWKASIEMMSGLTIFLGFMTVKNWLNGYETAWVFKNIVMFLFMLVASIKSNMSFEERLYNIMLYQNNFGELNDKISSYLGKIKNGTA